MNAPFSIVIPVKNEAINLPLCLESVKEYDDVVVVDSGSMDATLQIAAQFSRQVVEFKWDGHFPKKRNWMLRTHAFKHPWILFLDADERMTPEFKAEVERTLENTAHNAFWIRYKNWFMGKRLRHGDTMRKLALLRLGHGEYERVPEENWSLLDMEIHEHPVVDGTVGVIRSKIEHHDLRYLHDYYTRHNDYSSWEAHRLRVLTEMCKLTFRQRVKYRTMSWPIFPVFYFIASYFLKAGFMDGRPGFFFAVGKMFYFYQIQAKSRELE